MSANSQAFQDCDVVSAAEGKCIEMRVGQRQDLQNLGNAKGHPLKALFWDTARAFSHQGLQDCPLAGTCLLLWENIQLRGRKVLGPEPLPVTA